VGGSLTTVEKHEFNGTDHPRRPPCCSRLSARARRYSLEALAQQRAKRVMDGPAAAKARAQAREYVAARRGAAVTPTLRRGSTTAA
jgi:hypothetical protein